MKELYEKYIGCAGRVTTDSRAISGGEMFFALRGETFDGNEFAPKALELGASYAVVNADAVLPDDSRFIRVEDPLKTLTELAIWHREHVLGDRRLPVIGLTGTNGKTTTKELISAVLRRRFRVCATEGNLNNDIGVPLSILKIRKDTEIAVIEMGASHPDDIAKLVKVSRPDYGLITNVGKAHLLGFGSFEGVKAAKGELYNWLGAHEGSLIFLNEDDADLVEMARRQHCHVFGYGRTAQNASVLPSSPEEPFVRIRLGSGREVTTHLVGSYNAVNVLAAIAVGQYFGVSEDDAAQAVSEYVPVNNRSQMSRTASNTLIVDAYNANPSSMAAALDNFEGMEAENKIALLGDMRELGADSLSEHISVVRRVVSSGVRTYLVGEEFGKALAATGMKVAGHYATSDELAAELSAMKCKGAVILIKGSRGIRMEKVIPVL